MRLSVSLVWRSCCSKWTDLIWGLATRRQLRSTSFPSKPVRLLFNIDSACYTLSLTAINRLVDNRCRKNRYLLSRIELIVFVSSRNVHVSNCKSPRLVPFSLARGRPALSAEKS
uniref:Uncharacterized protein n=1 Tax=Cacopsylla melanoneura TaxID=428564 RepID=A0A8D8RTA2_9HEMI